MAAHRVVLQRREKQHRAANWGLLQADGSSMAVKCPCRTVGDTGEVKIMGVVPRVGRDRPFISREISTVKIVFEASGLFAAGLCCQVRVLHRVVSPCFTGVEEVCDSFC